MIGFLTGPGAATVSCAAEYNSARKDLRKWHRAACEQASDITYGVSAFGHRRWGNPDDRGDRWEWNQFQLAINFEVQGTGADALKIALVNLGRFLADDARVVLPVHDSALIQCPKDEADAVAECTRATMAEAFYEILGKSFPVKVDTKISSSWGG
jgi:DNA polymerase-1